MKKFILTVAVLLSLATNAYAGNCDNPDDRASDGSRCGDRSATSRPGGR